MSALEPMKADATGRRPPYPAFQFGLALLGEGLWTLDRIFALRHRDEGRIIEVVHCGLEGRHVERAHHDLLGRAHRHRRAGEDVPAQRLAAVISSDMWHRS